MEHYKRWNTNKLFKSMKTIENKDNGISRWHTYRQSCSGLNEGLIEPGSLVIIEILCKRLCGRSIIPSAPPLCACELLHSRDKHAGLSYNTVCAARHKHTGSISLIGQCLHFD